MAYRNNMTLQEITETMDSISASLYNMSKQCQDPLVKERISAAYKEAQLLDNNVSWAILASNISI